MGVFKAFDRGTIRAPPHGPTRQSDQIIALPHGITVGNTNICHQSLGPRQHHARGQARFLGCTIEGNKADSPRTARNRRTGFGPRETSPLCLKPPRFKQRGVAAEAIGWPTWQADTGNASHHHTPNQRIVDARHYGHAQGEVSKPEGRAPAAPCPAL